MWDQSQVYRNWTRDGNIDLAPLCELDCRAQKKGIHYVRFLSNEQYHRLDLPPVTVLASDHCFINWGKQTISLRKLSETDFKLLIFFLLRRGSGTMGKHISHWHIICLFPGDVKCYGTWFYSQGFKLLCSFWIRSVSTVFPGCFHCLPGALHSFYYWFLQDIVSLSSCLFIVTFLSTHSFTDSIID